MRCTSRYLSGILCASVRPATKRSSHRSINVSTETEFMRDINFQTTKSKKTQHSLEEAFRTPRNREQASRRATWPLRLKSRITSQDNQRGMEKLSIHIPFIHSIALPSIYCPHKGIMYTPPLPHLKSPNYLQEVSLSFICTLPSSHRVKAPRPPSPK